MKIENIKPIPKYIEKMIIKKDKSSYMKYSGTTRFYSYFTKNDKELVKVTVACKNRGKKWYCKQVAIHGVHSKIAYVKDIQYCWIGGYVVGWYQEGLSKVQKYYEDGIWYEAEDKYFDPFAPVMNLDYILKLKEYKYSAIDRAYTDKYLKYLRLYEKYPQMELLVKFGLHQYSMSKIILNKTAKDKKFCKWLIDNRQELSINNYYVSTVILSYKMNKPFKIIQQYEENKKYFCKKGNFERIKSLINKNDYEEFLLYLFKNNASLSAYQDYIIACNYLNINMSIERNKLPRNFRKWHDIRIDQYHTQKAIKDKEERKVLYDKFDKVANKYLPLQRIAKENFVMIIAKSPSDLLKEGEILNHCVGRMNYDQKFAREESLIFFIRNKEEPQKPFVTLEYSLKSKKILQCYGYRDSRPSQEVLDYANNVWLPYANKKLKKLVA